jgi:hypothetical protein
MLKRSRSAAEDSGAEQMASQKERRGGLGFPDGAPEEFVPESVHLRKVQLPPAANDRGDSAEQLVFVKGRVWLGRCVSPGSEQEATVLPPFLRHAMNAKTACAQMQDDISAAGGVFLFGANGQKVAGINRRNHASTELHDAHLAEAAQDLCSEIELDMLARRRHRGWHGSHGLGANHEVFLLKRHCAWVAESLPQANAMVSKTFSHWKAGFA